MRVPIGHPVPLSPGAGCAGSHFPGGQKPDTNHAVRQSLTRLSRILFAAVCVSRSAPAFASAPVLTFASTPPFNELRLQIVFAVGGRTAHAVFANHIAIPSSYIPLTEIHCIPMGFPHNRKRRLLLTCIRAPCDPTRSRIRRTGRTRRTAQRRTGIRWMITSRRTWSTSFFRSIRCRRTRSGSRSRSCWRPAVASSRRPPI
jgi:hypothetical protein